MQTLRSIRDAQTAHQSALLRVTIYRHVYIVMMQVWCSDCQKRSDRKRKYQRKPRAGTTDTCLMFHYDLLFFPRILLFLLFMLGFREFLFYFLNNFLFEREYSPFVTGTPKTALTKGAINV